jgi:hypothetical protein
MNNKNPLVGQLDHVAIDNMRRRAAPTRWSRTVQLGEIEREKREDEESRGEESGMRE